MSFAGAIAAVLAVLASSAAAADSHLRINFAPRAVRVGTHLTLNIRSEPTGAVRLTATPPLRTVRRVAVRHVSRSLRRGSITIDRAGTWKFRATQAKAWATLRLTVVAQTPNGIFGPPGAAGCNPASPRNQVHGGFSHFEVLGTSTSGRFWGLFAFLPVGTSWASEDTAAFNGLVGKQMKIVFKFDILPAAFYAIGPDGVRVPPVWGPDRHLGSNWGREGVEWGAGFSFDQAGCWRIHTVTGRETGDIWVDVRS